MPKKITPHLYSDRAAFERLLLLIATFLDHPGIGCPEPHAPHRKGHHQALLPVQQALLDTAKRYDIELTSYALPTLRKDLETLRRYGILDRHMYRWGYYLGTGALKREELAVALDALASLAKDQGDPQVRRMYAAITQRLRGLNLQLKGKLLYPVRRYLNHTITSTDPDEMMTQGKHQDGLFHSLATLEQAISLGQPVELARRRDPYHQVDLGMVQVWPLQLVYHDIAWYLICEHYHRPYFAINRMDRFSSHCRVLQATGRGVSAQQKSLQAVDQLLQNGWGLYLGEPEAQQAELAGQLPLTEFKVRFYPPVAAFILEGDRRHPRQRIRCGPQNQQGQVSYVDYTVPLPDRSFNEFSRWVNRFLGHVQVLAPPSLVTAHRDAIAAQMALYESENTSKEKTSSPHPPTSSPKSSP